MASIEDRSSDVEEMQAVNGEVGNTGLTSTTSRCTARADPDNVSHVQQDDGKVAVPNKSAHRKKQLHSLYLFISFISLGMIVALNGPTFLDLILVLGVDIERGTVFFTSGSIGYLCGSLIGGVVYDKFSKSLTLFFSTLVTGVATIAIPWCAYLPLMCVVNAFRAAAMGGLDTGGNAMLVNIWGTNVGIYMQALHFAFGFGGIIAPLVAAPFLAPKPSENDNASVTQLNNVTGSLSSARNGPFHYQNVNNNSSVLLGIDAQVLNESETSPLPADAITQVYVPYLILGLISAASAFPFLEMFWTSRKEEKKRNSKTEAESEDKSVQYIPLTLPLKVTLLVLMGLYYVFYCCVEDTFASFIMTFVVEHLDWSKTKGTLITSVFWIAFSVGRLLAIGITKFLTPWRMLLADFIMMDLAFLALYLGVESSEAFCWVATVIIAVSMASIFPTGITWIEKRIMKVTGKVASLLLVCASGGTMANPILVGYLFQIYTPMWFVYLLFGQALFCSLIFAVTSILVFWLHKKWKDRKLRGDDQMQNGPPTDILPKDETLIQETGNV